MLCWLMRAPAFTLWPEFSVTLFALLLNHPWEFIQAPLFAGMASMAHWDGVKACTRAALGDAVIMLFVYWGSPCWAEAAAGSPRRAGTKRCSWRRSVLSSPWSSSAWPSAANGFRHGVIRRPCLSFRAWRSGLCRCFSG